MRACAAAGVDAVIVQDLGVATARARDRARRSRIHASTQMTCTDAVVGGARARELGATRVILARELSLDDIASIAREHRRRGRGLRPRRALHLVLGPVPHERGHRRAQRQPRRVRAGVPPAVRARGRRRASRHRRRAPTCSRPRISRRRALVPRPRRARRVVAQDRGAPQGPGVRRRDDAPLPRGHRRRRRRRHGRDDERRARSRRSRAARARASSRASITSGSSTGATCDHRGLEVGARRAASSTSARAHVRSSSTLDEHARARRRHPRRGRLRGRGRGRRPRVDAARRTAATSSARTPATRRSCGSAPT